MFQHGRSVFEREKYILQMLTKRDRVKCNVITSFLHIHMIVHTPTIKPKAFIAGKNKQSSSQIFFSLEVKNNNKIKGKWDC